MSTSLEAGGSPSGAGEDVEREEPVYDRVTNPMHSNSGSSKEEVVAIEQHLSVTRSELQMLGSKHELLQRNHKMLAERARRAGVQ
jgi:hypothetical protein